MMQYPSLAPTVLLSAIRLSGKSPATARAEDAEHDSEIAGTGAGLG